MHVSQLTRRLLASFTWLTLAVVYLPLGIVAVLSFNTSRTFAWPPDGFTFSWWRDAFGNEEIRTAFANSLKAAAWATGLSLLLGTLLAFALRERAFFGRNSINFLVVLPIALPGIATGLALNRAIGMSWRALVVAHTTFCIVVVFNNAVARLRRLQPSLEEASADLGADSWQTFRFVTFPQLRSALFAGGLLAFALSFDEIIVTTFTAGPGQQTLPLWIAKSMFRPNDLPLVNVMAVVTMLASIVPVWLAQRLTSDNRSDRR